jgi:hypothetical protein
MGVAPLGTSIAATAPAEIPKALEAWEGAVDAVVLRLLPASPAEDAHTPLVRAGAPGRG